MRMTHHLLYGNGHDGRYLQGPDLDISVQAVVSSLLTKTSSEWKCNQIINTQEGLFIIVIPRALNPNLGYFVVIYFEDTDA